MSDQIKVSYIARAGHKSRAYIDAQTGEGTDKYTDIPLILEWSDVDERWNQVDTWEWVWGGPHEDRFMRVKGEETP